MREIIIEALDNAKIKYLRKICTNSNFGKKEKLFMVETKKLIDEVMYNSEMDVVFNLYTNSNEFNENAQNNFLVTKQILHSLSDVVKANEQICFVRINVDKFDLNQNILVFDNIQDPGNIGTLLRSANAFNFKNILAINSCSIYNPKVIRSAKGSLFDLNIKTLNLADGELFLKENNYHVIGTNLYGDEVSELKFIKQKFALILGNEGQGMSKELIKLSQSNIKIQTSNVESLNVAVAGSILMYELTKLKLGE